MHQTLKMKRIALGSRNNGTIWLREVILVIEMVTINANDFCFGPGTGLCVRQRMGKQNHNNQ